MNRFMEGNTIYLRAIEASDAGERYLSWLNDEEVTRGLASGVFPSTLEALKSYVQNINASKNAVMFAICDKDQHVHIGNIKLDNFDWINRTCGSVATGHPGIWRSFATARFCAAVQRAAALI